MIESGFYGTHEDHPEGLAPGMPCATPFNSYCGYLPQCSCDLGQRL